MKFEGWGRRGERGGLLFLLSFFSLSLGYMYLVGKEIYPFDFLFVSLLSFVISFSVGESNPWGMNDPRLTKGILFRGGEYSSSSQNTTEQNLQISPMRICLRYWYVDFHFFSFSLLAS